MCTYTHIHTCICVYVYICVGAFSFVEKQDSKGVLCIPSRKWEENIKIDIKGTVLRRMY
jgi:hypothetical protein